jgi:hydrogenase nickel incorporation protein HypA/HybF
LHELSIASAVQDTVVRYAEGRDVAAVQMRMGRLRQVVPSSLSFYFEIVGRDTVTAGARLDLELVDARLRCDCGAEWDPAPAPAESAEEMIYAPQFRCPACGEGGAKVIAGEEMEVESIEVVAPAAPAHEPSAG